MSVAGVRFGSAADRLSRVIEVEEDHTLVLRDVAAQITDVLAGVDGVHHRDPSSAALELELVHQGHPSGRRGLDVPAVQLNPTRRRMTVRVKHLRTEEDVVVPVVRTRRRAPTDEQPLAVKAETTVLGHELIARGLHTLQHVGHDGATKAVILKHLAEVVPDGEVPSTAQGTTAEAGLRETIHSLAAHDDHAGRAIRQLGLEVDVVLHERTPASLCWFRFVNGTNTGSVAVTER